MGEEDSYRLLKIPYRKDEWIAGESPEEKMLAETLSRIVEQAEDSSLRRKH